ncbi:unnamed protein product [Urochloa decumbens]|uniref:Uncharacterized protein n=1 Tax=Urochloa decumbens TaxID=240449 RepID=A0ABC9BGB6_9POAL
MLASRLLFQSNFSGMSRSASLLGAHASAAARAGTSPAARYFDVFPCSYADAKTSSATTESQSTITNNGIKPGFLEFAKVVKRTFSSRTSKSNSHNFTMGAEMAARQAQDAACEPFSVIEQVRNDVDTTIALMAFTCLGILYMSANDSTSTNSGSSCCSNCCNRQCQGLNPKVQQD